jgi:hypothetical protein
MKEMTSSTFRLRRGTSAVGCMRITDEEPSHVRRVGKIAAAPPLRSHLLEDRGCAIMQRGRQLSTELDAPTFECGRGAVSAWRAGRLRGPPIGDNRGRAPSRLLPGHRQKDLAMAHSRYGASNCLRGSNQDSPPAPESGVLPGTPRGSDSADWLTIRGTGLKYPW